MRRLIWGFAGRTYHIVGNLMHWLNYYSMTLRPLTQHGLEFLSLKGGCTGSSKSTLVKIPHCWKSHVAVFFMRTAKTLIRLSWCLGWSVSSLHTQPHCFVFTCRRSINKSLNCTQLYLHKSLYSKTVWSGHLEIDKTKIFMTIGSLMKVESTYIKNYKVKPILSGHSEIDKTKILMTKCSLTKV